MKLTIKTGNVAFDDDKRCEIVRILRDLAEDISKGYDPIIIRDINGNKVGAVCYETN